jgi:hypothetical protein
MNTSIVRVARRLTLLSAALIAAGLATPASADDPSFVGTWAGDLEQCKTPQEQQGAPMVIAKDRYDQHEAHCEFKSVEGAAPDWKIKADCTIEGGTQAMDFAFTTSGDTLTITDDTGTQDLLRCP